MNDCLVCGLADGEAGDRGMCLRCATEFRYHTDNAVLGVAALRQLPDDDVLAVARDERSPEFAAFFGFMGQNTNPLWITSQAAYEAYRRGVMEPEEMDLITG